MNKQQLSKAVSSSLQISHEDALVLVNSIINNIQNALAKDEKVVLIGFGTFEVRTHHGREFHNPATGQIHNLEDSRIPYFKAGKILKQELNNNNNN